MEIVAQHEVRGRTGQLEDPARIGMIEVLATEPAIDPAALAVALQDADASLRAEAVDALGEIGGPTAIRLLRQASMDPHVAVREQAAELLAELSGDAAEDIDERSEFDNIGGR